MSSQMETENITHGQNSGRKKKANKIFIYEALA